MSVESLIGGGIGFVIVMGLCKLFRRYDWCFRRGTILPSNANDEMIELNDFDDND
jgi:hypothetical protein